MLARKKVLGNYNVGKTVGQGAFSKVKLGVHKETGQKVAIKIIDKKLMAQKAAKAKKTEEERKKKKEAEEYAKRTKEAQNNPDKRESVASEGKQRASVATTKEKTETNEAKTDEKEEEIKTGIAPDAPSFVASLQLEVQLMMRLDHPNIINLYSIMETEDECFVVMEYAAGGELIEYIAARNYLTEREARKFFRQIISAMDHCHLASVVHRDLKLENLLLNDSRDILISDFGLGRTYNPEVQEYLKTFCGTPNYAAVELISGIPYNGIKSDIWAMGVALYVMMTGKTPFTGATISQLYSKIKAVDYKCPDYFSGDLKALLAKMLKKDPVKRADMEALRADPWVNFEEVERPLRIVPKVTGIASAAQITQFISSITKTPEYTLYTIRQHTRDGTSMEGAGEEKNKSVQARRKSLSVQAGSAQLSPVNVGRSRVGSRRFSNVGTIITGTIGDPIPPLPGQEDVVSPLPGDSGTGGRPARDPRRMSLQENQMPKVPPLPSKYNPNPADIPGAVNTTSPPPPVAEGKRARRASINIDFFQRGRKTTAKGADESPSASRSNTPDSTTISTSSVRRKSAFKPPNALAEDDRQLVVMKRMAQVSPEVNTLRPTVSGTVTESTQSKSFGGSLFESDSSSFFSPVGSSFSPTGTTILSDQEIEKWHEFNKPPKEIRTARYSFNPKTTSTLSPSYIFQDVHRVLVSMQKLIDGTLQFKRKPEYYLIQCHMSADGEEVEFDVEVCKVWLLNLHGVRIKKQGGSAIKFKDAYSMIVDTLNIS
ncbi:kinase-like protein [Rhizoclosmatium globosum]|uniref:non-specific serine/threonine protein kinase n=1 Tax=Rhizoclosmatium globosum TaxID=329046 RepID=A0A1Y2BM73_9FUNG|nr:kinase-like protein [Rhizoclosmatium globosum]|eukprot:ORY35255.1 kinase-like protein [Rhizoclosmatium globosum]